MVYDIICLFFYAALTLAEVVPLIRNKQWKIVKITVPILFATLVLNLLWGLGVKLPNPNNEIKQIILLLFKPKL